MKKLLNSVLILSAFLISFSSVAAAAAYEIDESHSSVAFKVKHFVSIVRGNFESFKGTVEFDEANPAASSTSVSIDAKTINTSNAKRDEHLRNPDFFEVEKYPQITFTSTKVEDGKITGNLTMHGVTKEVVLDYTFNGTATDPWGGQRAGFSATTEIDRKDFGITFNKVLDNGGLMLGEKVQIEIEIEAVKKS